MVFGENFGCGNWMYVFVVLLFVVDFFVDIDVVVGFVCFIIGKLVFLVIEYVIMWIWVDWKVEFDFECLRVKVVNFWCFCVVSFCWSFEVGDVKDIMRLIYLFVGVDYDCIGWMVCICVGDVLEYVNFDICLIVFVGVFEKLNFWWSCNEYIIFLEFEIGDVV